MSSRVGSLDEPRAPRAWEMAAPALVAPLVAAVTFGAVIGSVAAAERAAAAALAGALLVGWPLIFWLFDHGRTRLRYWLIVGAITGAAPLLAALASGVLGLYVRSSDLSYVRWALARGAAIPWYGTTPWPRFLWLELLAVATGLVAMAATWALVRRR